jgi:hypothetical protein
MKSKIDKKTNKMTLFIFLQREEEKKTQQSPTTTSLCTHVVPTKNAWEAASNTILISCL